MVHVTVAVFVTACELSLTRSVVFFNCIFTGDLTWPILFRSHFAECYRRVRGEGFSGYVLTLRLLQHCLSLGSFQVPSVMFPVAVWAL